MVTTAILGEDATTIVQEDRASFEWDAVLAGAVIGAGITLFLILVGAALGLSLAGTRNTAITGVHTFLTLGAIYFFAAQAFGFAIGGHITGKLMRPALESEAEHFRTDVHGLALWSLAAVFGFGLAALTVAVGIGQVPQASSPPMAYWSDKLFAGATPQESAVPVAIAADRKAEAERLLAVDAVRDPATMSDDRRQLITLVSAQTGAGAAQAQSRVESVEDGVRAQADAARHTALYLAMWTVFALLFGAFVAVVATIHARWRDQ
jgi:hypothetical protein